jgi:hypothetical protein
MALSRSEGHNQPYRASTGVARTRVNGCVCEISLTTLGEIGADINKAAACSESFDSADEEMAFRTREIRRK